MIRRSGSNCLRGKFAWPGGAAPSLGISRSIPEFANQAVENPQASLPIWTALGVGGVSSIRHVPNFRDTHPHTNAVLSISYEWPCRCNACV